MKKCPRVLITAGPTREYLDPVRYFSNASSGKTGIAIAQELMALGFSVRLILGPGPVPPGNIPVTRVVSARDMLRKVSKRFSSCDVFVSCAAVSDYRPANTSRRKIKKSGSPLKLRLLPNPDILAEAGRRKGARLVIGFALEDQNGLKRARQKLLRKNCDIMVLNGPEALESLKTSPTLLFPDRRPVKLGKITKKVLAQKLCREILNSIRKASVRSEKP